MSNSSTTSTEPLKSQTQQQLAHLMHLGRASDIEITRLFQLGLAPFKGDKDSVETLRRGMKEGLVMSSVRDNLEVKDAVKLVLERRRTRPS